MQSPATALRLYALMLAQVSARCATGYRELGQNLEFPDAQPAGAEVVCTALPSGSDNTGTPAWHTRATTADGQPLAHGVARITRRLQGERETILPQADLDSDFRLHRLTLGDTAHGQHRFSDIDLDRYLGQTGDRNPWLRDATAAQAAGFGARLLPGPLLCQLLGDVLARRFAGCPLHSLGQRLAFSTPALVNENLSATITVTRLQARPGLASIAGLVAGNDGRLILTSAAVLRVALA